MQMIYLCPLVTLIDSCVGILMYLMGLMVGIVSVRGIRIEECYWNFAWRKNYVCKIHEL